MAESILKGSGFRSGAHGDWWLVASHGGSTFGLDLSKVARFVAEADDEQPSRLSVSLFGEDEDVHSFVLYFDNQAEFDEFLCALTKVRPPSVRRRGTPLTPGLSARAVNRLEAIGIETFEQLHETPYTKVAQLPGIGTQTLAEIRRSLQKRSFSVDHWPPASAFGATWLDESFSTPAIEMLAAVGVQTAEQLVKMSYDQLAESLKHSEFMLKMVKEKTRQLGFPVDQWEPSTPAGRVLQES